MDYVGGTLAAFDWDFIRFYETPLASASLRCACSMRGDSPTFVIQRGIVQDRRASTAARIISVPHNATFAF